MYKLFISVQKPYYRNPCPTDPDFEHIRHGPEIDSLNCSRCTILKYATRMTVCPSCCPKEYSLQSTCI